MTGSQVLVRAATMADADFIAEANVRLARETEDHHLAADIIGPGVRAALGDAAKATYFIAEAGGRAAGTLMITHEWSDWRNGDLWWIQSVYVLPEFRRGGVFRALYEHVRAAAHAGGAAGLRLYVEKNNAAALATYARMGMRATPYLVMEDIFREA